MSQSNTSFSFICNSFSVLLFCITLTSFFLPFHISISVIAPVAVAVKRIMKVKLLTISDRVRQNNLILYLTTIITPSHTEYTWTMNFRLHVHDALYFV